MSITSEIERIKTNIANAYASLEEKGATLPAERNSANLSAVIVEVPTGGGDEELTNSFISTIDNSLGSNCTKLPNGITSIGKYAFYQCTNLALKELPNSVETIESYAFYYCTNLALAKLSNNLKTIGSNAFGNCTKLAIEEIPDAITKIENYTFSSCSNMPLKKLPSSLKTIGNSSFSYCNKLEISEIPENVETIGNQVFQGAKSTSTIIDIKSTKITSIGSYCFDGSSFKTLIMRATTPPKLVNSNAVSNMTTIYIPDESLTTYQSTTNWSSHKSKMKPLSEYGG